MKFNILALPVALLFIVLTSSSTHEPRNVPKSRPNSLQLNINILIDLSDRIDPKISPDNPGHLQKDMAVINHLTKYFAEDMRKKGTYQSKGKLRVNFYPRPNDPNIQELAEKLSVDLSCMTPVQKKLAYTCIEKNFNQALTGIYSSAIKDQRWIGSDIWRFFKNDVSDYCIEKKPEYRNILIILTDGYIYHKDSKQASGNRYSYLLPALLNKHRLRNNPNWKSELVKQDFGLITTRNDLNNLEVMVLEVTPSPNNKDDEDIIKEVLSKWFKEMRVKRYAIYNSDLPQYTKQRIDDFLDK